MTACERVPEVRHGSPVIEIFLGLNPWWQRGNIYKHFYIIYIYIYACTCVTKCAVRVRVNPTVSVYLHAPPNVQRGTLHWQSRLLSVRRGVVAAR